MTLAPVERPDGRLYRPRKLRTRIIWTGVCAGDESVIVLGTHDPEAACWHAHLALQYSPLSGCALSEQWSRGWWRDSIRDGEPYLDWDTKRGAAGVRFGVTDGDDVYDPDNFPVVCDNGCPGGWRGRHKFSCELAGPGRQGG